MIHDDYKKLAEIMHTIFCERDHEQDMMNFRITKKCKYYLENTVERTWELDEHSEWMKQAMVLTKISEPLNVEEVIRDIIQVYNIVEQFKKVNIKLLDFIKILIL